MQYEALQFFLRKPYGFVKEDMIFLFLKDYALV